MKVTDYIIEFLISKNVSDMFGYPGGVICHLIDSATKYKEKIALHTFYNEQGAALAACGYSLAAGGIGVVYATSGPGATNLVTGVANAYFDSIPLLVITGQVDTYALKGNLPIRQRGFQETDVVSIMQSITKYAIRIDNPKDIRYQLEKAYSIAVQGNPGPVLLDIPADVQRAEVQLNQLQTYVEECEHRNETLWESEFVDSFNKAKRPCFLLGNGIKRAGVEEGIIRIAEVLRIPVVCSMPAFDILEQSHELNYGFIGANGHRYANFVLGKSDLIIALGTRMDLKQVGGKREQFAPDAKLIRFDIDKGNLTYKVHEGEFQVCADLRSVVSNLMRITKKLNRVEEEWLEVCNELKNKLKTIDRRKQNEYIEYIGERVQSDRHITIDVGQSGVWIAQAFPIKKGQKAHMSAGHGAMGFSLPAAIGAYYAIRRPIVSFNGDGGIQMNIQELQVIAREKLPIKIVVLNNKSLGMIRGFQEANFNKVYSQTVEGFGYEAPNFEKIAEAYKLDYVNGIEDEDCLMEALSNNRGVLIEISFSADTELVPNFGQNGIIQDQRPYLDRELYDYLMEI